MQPMPPQLLVSVDGFQKVVLKGRGHVVPFIIRVSLDDKEWRVYHTEEQFKSLDNVLHKKPSIEGVLYKKAVQGYKSWNKRYFKLVGNTLCYANENGAITPKRGINLIDANRIVPTNETGNFMSSLVGGELLDARGSFEIRMPTETIYLNAPTRDDMENWVQKLNTAKRNRYSSPPVQRSNSKTDNMTDADVIGYEQKRVHYDVFLKSVCDTYGTSEFLASFLHINKYSNHEPYPQHRMMVDALQSNFNLILDLHENHGVPIDFVYKEVPFICEASSVGALQVVQYILMTEQESSALQLVNSTDKFGKTPLHAACSSACYEIAILLIANGASLTPTGTGSTPLHYIAQCGEHISDPETQGIFETLVNALATQQINVKDEIGQTPLHICAKKCYLIMLPLLLKVGANYNICDSTGKNVLHIIASNGSAKAHAMMHELLQFMFQNVRTFSDFDTNMDLLLARDNDGKSPIQYALMEPSRSRHVTLLQQHCSRLEDFKFSLLSNELIHQKPNVALVEEHEFVVVQKDEFSKIFAYIVEFMCSSCSLNEYHSDISKLIEKAIDLRDRLCNVLKSMETEPEVYDLLEAKVLNGIYPVLHTLFLKKNNFIDEIMNQSLLLFRNNVDYPGFGISEKFFTKIAPLMDKGLEMLSEIPTKVHPNDKLQCLNETLTLFDCDGADDIVPLLAYLMVRVTNPVTKIHWNAELDYICKLSPTSNYIMLQAMISFFQSASMKKKNGIVFVEGAEALASNTIQDLNCLWMDIRKEENAVEEMQALYALFLGCANNFSGANEVPLDRRISETTLTSHYMKSILSRLQLVLSTNSKGACTVKYGDFVDTSIFAKIACSFASLQIL